MQTLLGGGSSGAGGSSGGNGGGGGGNNIDENDGATYLYVTFGEGRTSPMLGIGVNGTVTVDWGDGTDPDVLEGISENTVQWTPKHTYDKPGDYVIRLTVDGEARIFGNSTSNQGAYILRNSTGTDATNGVYQYAIKRIVVGSNVDGCNNYAYGACRLFSIKFLTDKMLMIGVNSLSYNKLLSVLEIPASVTDIMTGAFNGCTGMAYYDFTSCTSVPALGGTNAFTGIPADCEIRVPAALYDEWIAATNWATYASYIKAY